MGQPRPWSFGADLDSCRTGRGVADHVPPSLQGVTVGGVGPRAPTPGPFFYWLRDCLRSCSLVVVQFMDVFSLHFVHHGTKLLSKYSSTRAACNRFLHRLPQPQSGVLACHQSGVIASMILCVARPHGLPLTPFLLFSRTCCTVPEP